MWCFPKQCTFFPQHRANLSYTVQGHVLSSKPCFGFTGNGCDLDRTMSLLWTRSRLFAESLVRQIFVCFLVALDYSAVRNGQRPQPPYHAPEIRFGDLPKAKVSHLSCESLVADRIDQTWTPEHMFASELSVLGNWVVDAGARLYVKWRSTIENMFAPGCCEYRSVWVCSRRKCWLAVSD